MIYKLLFDALLVIGLGIVHSALASFKSKEIGKKSLPTYIYRARFSVIIVSYILIAAYCWQ